MGAYPSGGPNMDLSVDLRAYVKSSGVPWKPEEAMFRLEKVPREMLLRAKVRPLPSLDSVDRGAAGNTKSLGPILLDEDYTVMHGRHRLADAIVGGATHINAWRRVA